jgi:hypothetical protein
VGGEVRKCVVMLIRQSFTVDIDCLFAAVYANGMVSALMHAFFDSVEHNQLLFLGCIAAAVVAAAAAVGQCYVLVLVGVTAKSPAQVACIDVVYQHTKLLFIGCTSPVAGYVLHIVHTHAVASNCNTRSGCFCTEQCGTPAVSTMHSLALQCRCRVSLHAFLLDSAYCSYAQHV